MHLLRISFCLFLFLCHPVGASPYHQQPELVAVEDLSDQDLRDRIAHLEKKIRTYRYRAKVNARDAERLQTQHPGEATQLRRHSMWLERKARKLEGELENYLDILHSGKSN